MCWCTPVTQETEAGELLELGGGDYSEPRSCHCTPAWETEEHSISKKNQNTNFLVTPKCLTSRYNFSPEFVYSCSCIQLSSCFYWNFDLWPLFLKKKTYSVLYIIKQYNSFSSCLRQKCNSLYSFLPNKLQALSVLSSKYLKSIHFPPTPSPLPTPRHNHVKHELL